MNSEPNKPMSFEFVFMQMKIHTHLSTHIFLYQNVNTQTNNQTRQTR